MQKKEKKKQSSSNLVACSQKTTLLLFLKMQQQQHEQQQAELENNACRQTSGQDFKLLNNAVLLKDKLMKKFAERIESE